MVTSEFQLSRVVSTAAADVLPWQHTQEDACFSFHIAHHLTSFHMSVSLSLSLSVCLSVTVPVSSLIVPVCVRSDRHLSTQPSPSATMTSLGYDVEIVFSVVLMASVGCGML